MDYSPYKQCIECNRTMSVNDAHRKCQKCRNDGKWRKWDGYAAWQREARKRDTRAA